MIGYTTHEHPVEFSSKKDRRYKTQHGETYGISLSRMKSVSRGFGDVIFELDASKLRANHRIRPFQFGDSDAMRKSGVVQNTSRTKMHSEAEEFLRGSIKNISKYIVRIWVDKQIYDDMVDPSPLIKVY